MYWKQTGIWIIKKDQFKIIAYFLGSDLELLSASFVITVSVPGLESFPHTII